MSSPQKRKKKLLCLEGDTLNTNFYENWSTRIKHNYAYYKVEFHDEPTSNINLMLSILAIGPPANVAAFAVDDVSIPFRRFKNNNNSSSADSIEL